MRWLGIDGGGTKTAFCVFDEGMRPAGEPVRLGTCHFAQVGYDGMREVLGQGIERCASLGLLGNEWGVGLGLAGFGQEADVRARIRSCVSELLGQVAPGRPFELMNDVEAAHAAALDLADGIVVVAGTGSIAYGVNCGATMRCGGWGNQIGDEGSGWWLGREVVRAFSRQSDGRSRRGPLHDVVRDELGLADDYDLIGYMRDVVAGDRAKVAALGRLATVAAEMGDRDARDILSRAAKEDADLVAAIVRAIFSPGEGGNHGQRVPVSYVGGTFRAGEALLGPLRASLPTCCDLVPPAFGPEAGSCLVLRDRLRGEGLC